MGIVSDHEMITRLWQDRRLTTQEAARKLGINRKTLRERALALGLENRPRGRPRALHDSADRVLFEELWNNRVTVEDIANRLGLWHNSIRRIAADMGLPPRNRQRPLISLQQYLEDRAPSAKQS